MIDPLIYVQLMRVGAVTFAIGLPLFYMSPTDPKDNSLWWMGLVLALLFGGPLLWTISLIFGIQAA